MIPHFESFIHSCRTKPRAVARQVAAGLSPEELQRLVDRLHEEGLALAEYREMMAEGRRVHQERAAPPPKADRFVDSVDCWLSHPLQRDTEARRRHRDAA